MRKILYLATVGMLAATVAFASDSKTKEKKGANGDRAGGTNASVAVQVSFLPREVRIIREYYAQRYHNLPPGLQKKYRRTGQLPPGWQKKMEPFPVAIERQLQVLPANYERGVIDGHAVIYNNRTQVIADIAVLF